MKYDYCKIPDIEDRILDRYRHSNWLPEGYFCVRDATLKQHQNEGWLSIGYFDKDAGPKGEYRPLWDVYAPREVVEGRLKCACRSIGKGQSYLCEGM